MDNNKKNFDIYVFFSTFARNLIEVFIGTILYKKGFNLHNVILYYLLVNIFSFILAFLCISISKKYSNKILSIMSLISFVLLQIFLSNIILDIKYLYLLSFLFALYRRSYWMSRRYYTLKVIHKKDISKEYSIISILNQLAIIVSSYIGALLLDFISIKVLTIISIILYLISIYFINKLEFEHEKNNYKLDLVSTINSVPLSNIIHIGCYELQNVLKFLIPLYLFIYIKNNYSTIGIINLIVNLSTIIFTYLYAKRINKEKNYLRLSIILLIIINIFKINTFGVFLIIVSFIEGFINKMYEQSFQKEFLTLSKKFEYHNYNLLYEFTQNLFRTMVVFILYVFIKDIKIMIYIVLIFIGIGLLFKFNTNNDNIVSNIKWNKQKDVI